MSQDASVMVLQTLDGYRVALVFAAINLYIWNQNVWNINKEMLKAVFGRSPKYTTYEDVIDAANKIHDDIGYVEFGICVMREFFQTDFQQLVDDQPEVE
jgi:ABC-type glycerol-3-phosphate transport system substrate-binding protein